MDLKNETRTVLEDIADDMLNGNWGTAQDKFKALNCYPSEFQDYLNEIEHDAEQVKDFAMLGFYAKEFKPCE